MIHMVQINDKDYLDLVKAADDAKMTIEEWEAWCITEGVSNYRRHRDRENARREFVQALEDAYGVIPGGD